MWNFQDGIGNDVTQVRVPVGIHTPSIIHYMINRSITKSMYKLELILSLDGILLERALLLEIGFRPAFSISISTT
jgi:hypothetical protein